ncbi:Uncharacterized protein TCM_006661 [Theobroma cacao]|uniref:Uncharacterized protein n=1 Tax=Theobroma cacao TaxID=3641 RepID=A0A061DYA3_THECC|nr:Uncharacterized protein TCM_006661 [Theobroma cacao]
MQLPSFYLGSLLVDWDSATALGAQRCSAALVVSILCSLKLPSAELLRNLTQLSRASLMMASHELGRQKSTQEALHLDRACATYG